MSKSIVIEARRVKGKEKAARGSIWQQAKKSE
jgi:hypothetical protein